VRRSHPIKAKKTKTKKRVLPKTTNTTPKAPTKVQRPTLKATKSGEDEEGAEKAFADDGAYVKLKVDGEEKEVPVKDLTRLYGQEAALTRKSQEVAEQRKQAEAESQKHVSALQVLLTRAQEKRTLQGNRLDGSRKTRTSLLKKRPLSVPKPNGHFEEEAFLSEPRWLHAGSPQATAASALKARRRA
jgi:hypothetical protein